MPVKTKQDRHQMQFYSLDERISYENVVRFIDAFVDKIELDKLDFCAMYQT